MPTVIFLVCSIPHAFSSALLVIDDKGTFQVTERCQLLLLTSERLGGTSWFLPRLMVDIINKFHPRPWATVSGTVRPDSELVQANAVADVVEIKHCVTRRTELN